MTLLSSLETSANELELRKLLDALVVKPPSQKELCLRFHEACITEAAALLPPTSSTGSPEKPEKAETLQDEVNAVIEDVLEILRIKEHEQLSAAPEDKGKTLSFLDSLFTIPKAIEDILEEELEDFANRQDTCEIALCSLISSLYLDQQLHKRCQEKVNARLQGHGIASQMDGELISKIETLKSKMEDNLPALEDTIPFRTAVIFNDQGVPKQFLTYHELSNLPWCKLQDRLTSLTDNWWSREIGHNGFSLATGDWHFTLHWFEYLSDGERTPKGSEAHTKDDESNLRTVNDLFGSPLVSDVQVWERVCSPENKDSFVLATEDDLWLLKLLFSDMEKCDGLWGVFVWHDDQLRIVRRLKNCFKETRDTSERLDEVYGNSRLKNTYNIQEFDDDFWSLATKLSWPNAA